MQIVIALKYENILTELTKWCGQRWCELLHFRFFNLAFWRNPSMKTKHKAEFSKMTMENMQHEVIML